jgi:hypothetical protein
MDRINLKKKTGKFNWWWVVIIAMAVLWRFWDYGNKWVFNQDQGRDATIALYANRNGLIPEIGSPSSAGPFNFGPWYFWLIMGWEKIIPTINGPWIGFGLLAVSSVIMYAMIGGLIWGKTGMIMTGLLAATAVGQVQNSPDMLNTVIVGWSSAIAWLSVAKLVKNNNWIWGVLAGLGVGLSINFHFQSWGLMAIPLVVFLLNKFDLKKRLILGISMAGGWLVAFAPMLWFDLNHNWVWVKSVVEYYTVGVKKFYVPVRWLTEIRDFWPQLLGAVMVGINNFGYILVIVGVVIIIKKIIKKEKIDRFWLIVGAVMVIQILLMRNYKGVRSREYMIAFHGMIILYTSWAVMELYKWKKYMGVILAAVIIVMAGRTNWIEIKQYPSQAKTILEIKKELDMQVPGKVRLEDYQESDMVAMPLFYLYYRENRIDSKGTTIGFCDGNRYGCPIGETMLKNNYRIYVDGNENWYELTPENVYGRLMVNYGK